MPNLTFDGASNFTISGGNFNDVAGNIINYNIPSGSEGLMPNALTAPDTQNRLPRRERKRLAERERIGRLPSAQIQSNPSSAATTSPSVSDMHMGSPDASYYPRSRRSPLTMQPTSPRFSPSASESSFDSASEGYNTPSRHSSRHSTPPTDMEEHRSLGNSGTPMTSAGLPLHHRTGDVDLLTPLTDSLGLLRFTPASGQQTLPASHHDPTQILSPVIENSGPLDFERRRTPSGPPPPPPNSTRPVSVAQLAQMWHEQPNALGPPPPVPPRLGMLSPTGTSATIPVDTLSPFSHPMSVETMATTAEPRSSPTTLDREVPASPMQQELEDPSARFIRLQGRRASTKGYASGLTPNSYSPAPRYPSFGNTPSPPPPLPVSTRSTSSPSHSMVNERPITPVPRGVDLQADHWTANSINNWADRVDGRRSGGSDTQSSGDSRSVQPSLTPPHSQTYGQQHQHQLPQPHQLPPYHHYNNQPSHPQHFINGHPQSHNTPWQVGQVHPHQTPFGYNQAPHQPPFSGFPFSNAPAFMAPPFGAPGPFFNTGPPFGGPAFGGGL